MNEVGRSRRRCEPGRKKRYATRLLQAVASSLILCAAPAPASPPESIQVDLKLRTGGAFRAALVEHTAHGIVVVRDQAPYVFAWTELESGSAYVIRRDLLIRERGDQGRLSADDQFLLGRFALKCERTDLAARCFGKAGKIDRAFQTRARAAFDAYRRRRKESAKQSDRFGGNEQDTEVDADLPPMLPVESTIELADLTFGLNSGDTSLELRSHVMKVYDTFGKKVQEVLGPSVVAIETPHFLIWTDFEPRYRDRLMEWCESTYVALCAQFGLDPSEQIFLAKCPVFCFRSKARFVRFARTFDGFEGTGAVGYTRSIENNGHVHVALLRQGRSTIDLDRFASTLVHETTHAFIHRLYTHRLIPHWVNEGLADRMAENVLGDRCPNAENAALLASCYVRHDWPIRHVLISTGPIAVEHYPLAHSVVTYMHGRDAKGFGTFLRGLKDGQDTRDALAAAFDGLTIENLELRWRAWVTTRQPSGHVPPNGESDAQTGGSAP